MNSSFFPYASSEEPQTPHSFADREPSLWRAVITQALMDAASNSQKSEAIKWKAEAMQWLSGQSEEFLLVCEYAGLDPDYVRENAARAIARGCIWRLPAGMGWRTQNDNQRRWHAAATQSQEA